MSPVSLVIFALALFIEKLDSNIISTSLTHMAVDLHTSPLSLKLALTSYLLSLAIFIPISGWLADKFTAKKVFSTALFIFMLGSVLCAISNSLFTFVLARILQGSGAAMMSPVGRLLVIRNTDKKKLVVAMNWVTLPALIGASMGPVIGGTITEFLSWHWIFLVNVPISIICILIAHIYMPKDEEKIDKPLDIKGFFLSTVALAGIVLGSSVISIKEVPLYFSVPVLIVGLISGVAYYKYAVATTAPLLDIKLLKDKTFRTCVISASFFRIGFGSQLFVLPMLFQLMFKLNSMISGLILSILALGSICAKPLTRTLINTYGFRKILFLGSILMSMMLLAPGFFTAYTPIQVICVLLFSSGLVSSICLTSINTLAFENIATQQTSQAATIANVFQQAALGLGPAIAGISLETASRLGGGELRLIDFTITCLLVACFTMISSVGFKRLDKTAGASLTAAR